MTYASSPSVEALVKDLLEDRLAASLPLVDIGPSEWGGAAASVQVIAGRERLAEEDPPVILVSFDELATLDADTDETQGTVVVKLKVETGALWDRGARDVAGILIAACRIALLSSRRVTAWSAERLEEPIGQTERTLATATAAVRLKLPVGPKKGRSLNLDPSVTEAVITVERRVA